MPEHVGVLSSGQMTTAGSPYTLTNGPAMVFGYNLSCGTAISSITIADGSKTIWTDSIAAGLAAGNATVNNPLAFAMVCDTNLIVTIAGTAATGFVTYIPMTPAG